MKPMSVAAATTALVVASALLSCSEPVGGGSAENSDTAAARGSPSAVRPTHTAPDPPKPPNFEPTSEAWTFEDKEGVLLTTPHYRIFTTTARKGLKDRIPRFMETALVQYRSALVPLPAPTAHLETYLLANRPQWARITQRLMGADAEIYLRIQRGGFAADGKAILYELGSHDTYAIAAHEGWHQFTQRTFRNPLPIWLEEGLACYMEGFRWKIGDSTIPNFMPWSNVERFDELRSAARSGRLMSLEKLTRTSPQELMGEDADLALTYYAQLWALVHFLNEGKDGLYQDAFHQVILDAQAGRLIDRIRRISGARGANIYASRRLAPGLLEGWFGEPIADLEASYLAFVTDITRIGGKEFIVAGRSPATNTAAAEQNEAR